MIKYLLPLLVLFSVSLSAQKAPSNERAMRPGLPGQSKATDATGKIVDAYPAVQDFIPSRATPYNKDEHVIYKGMQYRALLTNTFAPDDTGYPTPPGKPWELWPKAEVAYVEDFAALSAFAGPEQSVIVGEKLRGGTFVKDNTATTVDEGVVIVTTWKRSFSGPINAEWFGITNDGLPNDHAPFVAIEAYVRATPTDIYIPCGTYDIGDHNMPFRSQAGQPMVDYGIAILGSGACTVIKSSSTDGADVFQLNGVKNLTLKDFTITATLSAFDDAGSNGISITGGGVNLRFENLNIVDLPKVPKAFNAVTNKAAYVDGGAAITWQPGTAQDTVGSVFVKDVYVRNARYGIGVDGDGTKFFTGAQSIHLLVDGLVVEDSYRAISLSLTRPIDGTINESTSVVSITNTTAKNCQQGIGISRMPNVSAALTVSTDLTATKLKVHTPNDLTSYVLLLSAAVNHDLNIGGNVKEIDTHIDLGSEFLNATIGHESVGQINYHVSGNATTDMTVAGSYGVPLRNSSIRLPEGFSAENVLFDTRYKNRVEVGSREYQDHTSTEVLAIPYTAPNGIGFTISRELASLIFQQFITSNPNQKLYDFQSRDGTSILELSEGKAIIAHGNVRINKKLTVDDNVRLSDTLNMDQGAVINVPAPTNDLDAANKQWTLQEIAAAPLSANLGSTNLTLSANRTLTTGSFFLDVIGKMRADEYMVDHDGKISFKSFANENTTVDLYREADGFGLVVQNKVSTQATLGARTNYTWKVLGSDGNTDFSIRADGRLVQEGNAVFNGINAFNGNSTFSGISNFNNKQIINIRDAQGPTEPTNLKQVQDLIGLSGTFIGTTDASGDVTIPHTLAAIPGYYQLTVDGTGARHASPHTATSTDFNVRVTASNAPVVAAAVIVYWNVR